MRQLTRKSNLHVYLHTTVLSYVLLK
jgi:hypothetical protein